MSSLEWTVARVLSFALYYSGGLRVFESLDRRSRPGPRCMVIYYHRVAEEPIGYRDVTVRPRTFRKHMEYLVRRGYGFLSLEQYHDYLRGERDLGRDAVLVTFDDGYRDNYQAALPVLRELGIPAAVFLCTGPMQTSRLMWWDRAVGVISALRRDGVRSLAPSPEVSGAIRELVDRCLSGSADRASRRIGTLVDRLKQMPDGEREVVLGCLEASSGSSADDERTMLTWDMVREMERSGIRFGAHSVTHPVLSNLDHDSALAEIAESKQVIEEQLGHPVTDFAYPYGKEGYFDRTTEEAVREAGFSRAYTTENGYNAPGADPFSLRRNGLRDIPRYLFAVRMAGFFEHPALGTLRSSLERRGAPSAGLHRER